MRNWRNSPDEATQKKVRACEARRVRDDRRAAELRARVYVWTYLRRGRLVPPTRCDACGARTAELRFYHPDPLQKRLLVWLCPSDRRAVPAARRAVIPHWSWPGHLEPLPTRPRWPRFALDAAWRDAADAALARTIAHLRSESEKADVYMSAFFRAAGEGERRRLVGHGLGLLRAAPEDRASIPTAWASWTAYGDPRVDEYVRRFVRDTKARFARARAEVEPRFLGDDEDYVADRGVIPVFEVRLRRRRHDAKRPAASDAIGFVPKPPEKKIPVPVSEQRPAHALDDAFFARLDALEAEHDARVAEIMARVDAVTVRSRPPVSNIADDEDDA
jgi:hypothetical protein